MEKIRPYYPSGGKGRVPYPLEWMLRVHCVQLLYNVSDPAMEDMLYEIESVRRFSGFQTSDPPSLPTCPVLSASGPHWPAGLPVERRSACLVRQTPGFAGSGTVLPPPGARLALPIAATTGLPPGPGQRWGQWLEPGQVQRQAWRFTSYWSDDGPQVNDVTDHTPCLSDNLT